MGTPVPDASRRGLFLACFLAFKRRQPGHREPRALSPGVAEKNLSGTISVIPVRLTQGSAEPGQERFKTGEVALFQPARCGSRAFCGVRRSPASGHASGAQRANPG